MSEIKSRTVTQEFDEKGNLVRSDVYEEFYPEKEPLTLFKDMSVGSGVVSTPKCPKSVDSDAPCTCPRLIS